MGVNVLARLRFLPSPLSSLLSTFSLSRDNLPGWLRFQLVSDCTLHLSLSVSQLLLFSGFPI